DHPNRKTSLTQSRNNRLAIGADRLENNPMNAGLVQAVDQTSNTLRDVGNAKATPRWLDTDIKVQFAGIDAGSAHRSHGRVLSCMRAGCPPRPKRLFGPNPRGRALAGLCSRRRLAPKLESNGLRPRLRDTISKARRYTGIHNHRLGVWIPGPRHPSRLLPT